MTFADIQRNILRINPIYTIYVNFRYLRFKDAIKIPILVNWGGKINLSKGRIKLNTPIHTGLIVIGTGSKIHIKGLIVFNGKARIGERSGIFVGPNGTLTFGKNIWLTSEVKINCFTSITFGDDCLVAWNVEILDTDFHKIMISGKIINKDKSITIGDRVWIGSGTRILKNTEIANDNIIGASSLLNKSYSQSFCIYAGNPAKIVKEGVTWEP